MGRQGGGVWGSRAPLLPPLLVPYILELQPLPPVGPSAEGAAVCTFIFPRVGCNQGGGLAGGATPLGVGATVHTGLWTGGGLEGREVSAGTWGGDC